jgi:hypothetical protein
MGILYNIQKVEFAPATNHSSFNNVVFEEAGMTLGGVIFEQPIDYFPIPSETDMTTLAEIPTKLDFVLTINFINASMEALAALFGASYDESEVSVTNQIQRHSKAVKLTSKVVEGEYYVFEMPNVSFKATGNLSINGDGASLVPVSGSILNDSDGVRLKIYKRTVR